MKRIIIMLCLTSILFYTTGCNTQTQELADTVFSEDAISAIENTKSAIDVSSNEMLEAVMEIELTKSIIKISDGTRRVFFELNDSKASQQLYAQLPISVEISNYSTNEKIFYPVQTLDLSDAPSTDGSIGTLACYSSWGNVIIFYGSFNPSNELYTLGNVVQGESEMSFLEGNITIEAEIDFQLEN